MSSGKAEAIANLTIDELKKLGITLKKLRGQDNGIPNQRLARAFRGVAVDGGILNLNICRHFLERFWGEEDVPDSLKDKCLSIWDGAHILELVFKCTLADFPDIENAKSVVASLSTFFREPTVYEKLRRNGIDQDQKLYTPKKERSMKFVARDLAICRDVLSNLPLYLTTLADIANSPETKEDVRAEVVGYISKLKDDVFQSHLTFLAGITRFLKRFSTEFQRCRLNVAEYMNLKNQLKCALGLLKLETPSPAVHTTTCDLRGGCCTGVKTCRESKFLCATNTTETCGGERCLADSESSVCCPVTAQCCMSRGKIACCIETDVWWKWPALLASSAFLLLTLALLYYTYKSTRSSRRNDRHVIHYDDMPPVHPPPYHLHHGYLGVLMKEHNSNESPPEYVSREGTPHSLVTLPAMMRPKHQVKD
ncbi:hypothetical protein ACHWQZ_G004284 [Mnemiopsis leidyi]